MKTRYFIFAVIAIAAMFLGSCKKEIYDPATKKQGISNLADAAKTSDDTALCGFSSSARDGI